LRGGTTRLLIGFSQALLLEQIDRFGDITFNLLERALALHDSSTALLAELLDLVCCYDHLFTLQMVATLAGAMA
jgi:hypothetical protein